ncbi:MAG: hypothetical protein U9R75_09595 [Candidatus Thermoplasmatota archaeon]|nr:hypothetical protein [Candidatus Thermoplasmatota archaeon]
MIAVKLTFRCEQCTREPLRVVDIKGTRAYIRSSMEELYCSRCGSVMNEV